MSVKPSSEKLGLALLQTIDPKEIADESMRQTVEILLNLIEQLHSKVEDLETENQRLRDENNRLQGEQGKPDIKGQKPRGFDKDYSSEKERKIPKKQSKSRKTESIKIDREEIVECEPEKLPADAEFKGYQEVIVQDIKLSTDNILFRKQKYYSASERKTYLAELPAGYEGEFGPGIKALVISLYYGGNMTQGKLLELLEALGISISAGHLSHLLIQNHQEFEAEKEEISEAPFASTPWQHLDQTSARVGGVNYTSNIICNPFYTVYVTTAQESLKFSKMNLRCYSAPRLVINNWMSESNERESKSRNYCWC
jgi:regulator of replication initiation timing